jgi:hypothetical protein
MRIMRIHTLLLLAVASFLFTQCEVERYGCTDPNAPEYDVSADIDDGSCFTTDPGQYTTCSPDAEGNLIITNQTGVTLYLYKNFNGDIPDDGMNSFVTCIPVDAENFLVHIPNQSLSILRLQIWKALDVTDKNNPDLVNVYRQWSVALSNTTSTDERASWLITSDDQYGGTGTLLVNYPAVDDQGLQVIYQVDIFLNNKNGAKLASLQPGITDKIVSVDFGIHYLYFHYWYSDPNSTTGDIVDIGWSESVEVVVNEQHKEREIIIPVYYSTVGKYGELTVRNRNTFAVNVYVNDKLIEDIAIVDGSPAGLSAVPAGEESTFLIPVNRYSVSMDDSKGDQVTGYTNVDIIQNEVAVLTTGAELRTIRIANLTSETLGLFTSDEQYLGLSVPAGVTSTHFYIPADLDTLLVINFAKTLSMKFAYNTSVIINELVEYEYNYMTLLSPWPVIDDIYQSPDISDSEETSMEGTVFLAETGVIQFDYNVSCEEGYDYFIFSIDGFSEINAVSGESGWLSFSKVLSAGSHSLKWNFVKDQTRTEGRDNVQIRNLTIE